MTDKADKYLYAPFIKVEGNDGGDAYIYAQATDSSLDLDRQIADPKWLAEAMPDWMRYGNVREMHQPKLAGVAESMDIQDGAYFIGATIIDKDAAEKVRKGGYKGLSIGVKGPRIVQDKDASGGRIIGGKIVEISLVDRPANDNSKIVMVKGLNVDALPDESKSAIDPDNDGDDDRTDDPEKNPDWKKDKEQGVRGHDPVEKAADDDADSAADDEDANLDFASLEERLRALESRKSADVSLLIKNVFYNGEEYLLRADVEAQLAKSDSLSLEEAAVALNKQLFEFDDNQLKQYLSSVLRYATLRKAAGDDEYDDAMAASILGALLEDGEKAVDADLTKSGRELSAKNKSMLKAVHAATVDLCKGHDDMCSDMHEYLTKCAPSLAEHHNSGTVTKEGDIDMDKDEVATLVKEAVDAAMASLPEAITTALSADEFKASLSETVKELITAEPELVKAAAADDGEETQKLAKELEILKATVDELAAQPGGSKAFLGGALKRSEPDETKSALRERAVAQYESLLAHPDIRVRNDAKEKLAELQKE